MTKAWSAGLVALVVLILSSGAFFPRKWMSASALGAQQNARFDNSWLDRVPNNWNRRMGGLPRPDSVQPIRPRCQDFVRQPETPGEHALVRAGWTLYGAVQSFGTTRVVTAMSAVDGMCRPMGHQAFVYWEGRYAGTLSPGLIRTGGRQVPIEFDLRYDPRRIEARRRYGIQARILIGGEPRFISTDAYPVITGGNPSTVRVIVQPIRR